jgi:DNA-directed RNA polymerase specialized sigma24 family protein
MTDSNDFQLLLDWLNQNAIDYRQALARLCRYFEIRGVWSADQDDLASEVLSRVAAKLKQGNLAGTGWAALLGIANYVFLEWRKRRAAHTASEAIPDLADPGPPADVLFAGNQSMWAVEECIQVALGPDERKTLLRYYCESDRGRRVMAQQLGLTANALRVRIHTSQGHLRTCVHCVDRLSLKDRATLLRDRGARSGATEDGIFAAQARVVREKLRQCSRRTLTYSVVIEPAEVEIGYFFPEIARRVKLIFVIPPSHLFPTYRVVLASRSDIRLERPGLKAESLGHSTGISVQLGVEQAQGRAFRANVYGESEAGGEPEAEVAIYRFTLSSK